MLKINHNQLIARFRSFRQQLRDCFESYSDSIIDLLDALAGNSIGSSSVAELSLSPLFQRTYNSVYKAIKKSFNTNNQVLNQSSSLQEKLQKLVQTVAKLIPTPLIRSFYLFAIDTTPQDAVVPKNTVLDLASRRPILGTLLMRQLLANILPVRVVN